MKELLGLIIVIALPIVLLIGIAEAGAGQQEAIVESLKVIAKM